MGVVKPKRSFGWTSMMAVAIFTAAGLSKGLPKDPTRVLHQVGAYWQIGASAFGLLLIGSFAWHGLDKSKEGHRPLGSVLVLMAIAAVGGAVLNQSITGKQVSMHMGAASRVALASVLVAAVIGVSLFHGRLERSRKPKAPSRPALGIADLLALQPAAAPAKKRRWR